MKAVLWFDGACRGNPGPSAGGAVLDPEGSKPEPIIADRLPYAGRQVGWNVPPQPAPITIHGTVFHGTDNEAEYHGIIVGLRKAIELGVTDLLILGDSKLVVNQVSGEWGIHKPHLRLLYEQARRLLGKVPRWSIEWIPREENAAADRVANEALTRSQTA